MSSRYFSHLPVLPIDNSSLTTMHAVPIRVLFVGNLAETTTLLDDLKYSFSKYGDVESCILHRFCILHQHNWRLNYHSYYAIVTFRTDEDAMRAMKDGDRNQISIPNKNLKVMPAGFWYQLNCQEDREDFLRKIEIYDKINWDYQYTQEYLQNDSKKVSIHILNDDCLRQIFEFLPISDRIRIERVCKRWKVVSLESWHTMRVLDFSFPKRESVNIRKISVPLYNTRTLHKLLLRCGRFLTQLDLFISPSQSLPEYILITLEQLCPNLTNVNVDFEDRQFTVSVSASVINALAKICKNITRLAIRKSFLHKLDNELSDFFSIHKNLEYLEINSYFTGSKCLTFLSAETLHTLILCERCIIDDRYLAAALERLRGLQKLILNGCFGVDKYTFKSISHYCINLKVLHIHDICDQEINSLKFSNLVKLENIKITCSEGVSDNYVTNMVLNCRELVDVNIEDCRKVTDAGLVSIATLPKLERLNINDIEGITDQGLRHIRDLKVLECRKCKCTEEGLSMVLRSSPQLRLLDISGCYSVNRHFLEIAKEICNRRTSNILLEVNITKLLFRFNIPNRNHFPKVQISVSPFLTLVYFN